jgi:RNA ligase (TIGR02306 family)
MSRKLASIQVVDDVKPIPGADNIEVASVLGWKVVVLKGKVKPGDYVIYIEVDSIVPDIPVFEFLRPYKFRVKTVRLRGQISSGLVMTLDEMNLGSQGLYEWPVGTDITEKLKITKYVEPIPLHLSGKVIGKRPPWVPKTDEFRLQSYPQLLEELGNQHAYISTKIDGTSSSIYYNPTLDEPFGVCSRNLNLARDENNGHWKVIIKHDIENKIKTIQLSYPFRGGFVIQGELAGPGIQKNRMNLSEIDLFVFQIFDIEEYEYISVHSMQLTCRELGLKTVDIFDSGYYGGTTIDQWISIAEGVYPGTKNPREGIVVKTSNPVRTDILDGRWLGFKVLNNQFLLKEE